MKQYITGIILCLCCFVTSLAQNKRALLIGISDYGESVEKSDTEWCNIHGANDVQMIEATLLKQSFKVDKLTDKKATASAIRKKFQTFQKTISKGDIVYMHFSCHGQPFEDISGDEVDGWDEAIIPYDAKMSYSQGLYEGKNHIIDDEIHELLLSIRKRIGNTGMVYVVVDACHAGSLERGEEEDDEVFVRGTTKGFSKTGKHFHPRVDMRPNISVKQNVDMSEIFLLEACRSYQSNYEIKQNGNFYGPLSYYVNEVLSRIILGKDVTWIGDVKKLMSSDRRLVRQNMVVESSIEL